MALGNLRSWNHPDFSMNLKLFTGSREGVLGKPFLVRVGGGGVGR